MPIPARASYSSTQLPDKYNRDVVRSHLNGLALAIPPYTTRQVVAATTVETSDDLLVCDATGGAFNVTLPLADQVQFLRVTIKRINAGAAVTIVGTVDASVNPTLGSQWSSLTVQSDGIRWLKLAAV